MKQFDDIENPKHYNVNGYEAIEVAEALGFEYDAYLFQAFKYLFRCQFKGNMLKDLEKCRYFIDRRIQQIYKDIEEIKERKIEKVKEVVEFINKDIEEVNER